MLEIAPAKVAYIIIRAREYNAKVAPHILDEGSGSEGEPDDILESFPEDTTRPELVAFIDNLNVDEKAHLVALTWIGRSTFEADELARAVEIARQQKVVSTAEYLLGIPLLADYLEEGLVKFGFSIEDLEGEIL